jgi:hypothetical protein
MLPAYEVRHRKANLSGVTVAIVGSNSAPLLRGLKASSLATIIVVALSCGLSACSTVVSVTAAHRAASSASPERPATKTPRPAESPTPTSAAAPTFAAGVDAFAQMLSTLPTDDLPESHTGYVRELFNLWIDANGNGCNTRAEVLITESMSSVTRHGPCTIDVGSWVSLYDGLTLTAAGDLDIDHVVPLSEAWKSGAWQWDAATREQFANDLGYAGSLLAVSAHANRSKGDKDPAQWMPQAGEACDYVERWIAVKYRWSLSVDTAERNTLSATLSGCATLSETVPDKALITVSTNPGGAPAPGPAGGNGSGDGITDPDYGTCKVAKANGRGPYLRGIDPEYAFYRDGDKDGMVCE